MKIAFTLITLALLFASPAHANMLVYPMQLKLSGKKEVSSTVKVTSQSDTTQYIRVSLKEVLHPATPQEKEVDVANWQGQGIILSPMKFALPAGASKTVRVISLNNVEAERIFRAYFEPVAGESNDDSPAAQIQGQVALTLIWGVLIRQVPDKPIYTLQRGKDAALVNNGNVRVQLHSYSQCENSQRDDQCRWSTLIDRIYPKETLRLPGITQNKPLRVRYMTENEKLQSVTLF